MTILADNSTPRAPHTTLAAPPHMQRAEFERRQRLVNIERLNGLSSACCDPAYGMSRPYAKLGPLAVLPVDGYLFCSWGLPEFIAGVDAITQEAQRGMVRACLLDVNCAGGSALGMDDMEQAVRRLKAAVPLHAICHDLCCSSAYWAVCLADEIAATPTAMAGSIGTILSFLDYSAELAAEGVRPIIKTSGVHKATAVYGNATTPEQEALLERNLAAHAADFFAVVSEGRGLPVDAIANMQAAVYYGQGIVEAGLADRVVSYRPYLEELGQRYAAANAARPVYQRPAPGVTLAPAPASPIAPVSPTSPAAPSQDPESEDRAITPQITPTPTTPTPTPTTPAASAAASTSPAASHAPPRTSPMTIDELKKSHPDLVNQIAQQAVEASKPAPPQPASAADLAKAIPDQAYCFDCLTKGLTLTDALTGYAKKLETANAELAKARGSVPQAPGFRAKDSAPAADTADALVRFPAMVNAVMEQRKLPIAAAMTAVAREHPELHKAYNAAALAQMHNRKAAMLAAAAE